MEDIYFTIFWIALGYGAMLLLIFSSRPSKKTRPFANRIVDIGLMIVCFSVFFAFVFSMETIIWVVIGFSLAGGTVTIVGWWKSFQRRRWIQSCKDRFVEVIGMNRNLPLYLSCGIYIVGIIISLFLFASLSWRNRKRESKYFKMKLVINDPFQFYWFVFELISLGLFTPHLLPVVSEGHLGPQ